MKGLAKFLGILFAIGYWLMVLGTILIAGIAAVLLIKPDILNRLTDLDDAVTITASGLPALTPEFVTQLRQPLLLTLLFFLIVMVLTLRTVRMIRRALRETAHGYPFSDTSVRSLRAAAILTLIITIVTIVFPVALQVMYASLLPVNTAFSVSFQASSLVYCLLLFLLASVAKYGNKLAPSEDVFPESSIGNLPDEY